MSKTTTLSKILKLKDNRKKEIEIEVKKASERVDEEKTKLSNLEKDYSETLQCFADINAQGVTDVNSINSYYSFFSRIHGKIDAQKKAHSRREDELAVLKNTLVSAHKEKRVFEILNEKTIKKDRKEKAAHEQKEADFLTIVRKLR